MLRTLVRVVSCAFAVAGVAGCGSSTGPDPAPESALLPASREVVLDYGEDVRLEGSVLRLTFAEVWEDSRCPVDVTCVWAGNAKVVIGIAAGMGPTHPLFLNTTLEPRSVVWSGVRVTLLELTPVPHAGIKIPPEDYTVRLKLEPAS